jgi:formamidopyrimidine-DNA glycosylase
MRVIEKRTFTVSYVVPENEKEHNEIKKIIKEVKKEKLDPDISKWKVRDNRKKYKN